MKSSLFFMTFVNKPLAMDLSATKATSQPAIFSYLILILLFCCPISYAGANVSSFPIQFDENYIAPALQIFVGLSVLSLAPGILMMLTSFTRNIVVLSILRMALGLQQTPPNSVLISLALFLTFFTMMPIINTIYHNAWQPLQNQQMSIETAIYKATIPLKKFMLNQTREKDLILLSKMAHEPTPTQKEDVKFYTLVPAFMLSELQTAFQIGFMIFLPFLLIDLIVSGILMTLGMMMVPPMSISLPVKILVFVLINGWDLVIQALAGSVRL